MLDRDPKIIARNRVRDEWTKANTPLADDPRFHTGWYDYGSEDPQVTFTNAEESTVNGGDTGVTAGTGSGGTANVRAGTLLANCWAGTRDDCSDVGVGGARVNPKEVAYQLAVELANILDGRGTTNPDTGDQELLSLAADGSRGVVDTDGEAPIYREEVTVRYTYAETKE